MVLDTEAFDPDAVFLDDIIDDEVLPRLSLAVDGLTEGGKRVRAQMELPESPPEQEVVAPSTHLPDAGFDPEQLEVYGWESSFWYKIRGYLGL